MACGEHIRTPSCPSPIQPGSRLRSVLKLLLYSLSHTVLLFGHSRGSNPCYQSWLLDSMFEFSILRRRDRLGPGSVGNTRTLVLLVHVSMCAVSFDAFQSPDQTHRSKGRCSHSRISSINLSIQLLLMLLFHICAHLLE